MFSLWRAKDEAGNDLVIYPWTALSRTAEENETLREAIRGGNGWPLPILPLGYGHRMAAQQAVFVCATKIDFALQALLDKAQWPQPERPERFVDQMEREQAAYPLDHPFQVIKQIRLPGAWRTDALRTLRQMGIAEETLFPGLDGAGRASRMHLVGASHICATRSTAWGSTSRSEAGPTDLLNPVTSRAPTRISDALLVPLRCATSEKHGDGRVRVRGHRTSERGHSSLHRAASRHGRAGLRRATPRLEGRQAEHRRHLERDVVQYGW